MKQSAGTHLAAEVPAFSPYLPRPAVIEKITVENEAADIRTFRLRFVDPADQQRFAFRVGQFAELSLLGVGEAPIGIASSPFDEDFVEFTVKRYPNGVVTTALHQREVGQRIGVRGPLGNGYPVEKMANRNIVIIGGGFAVTTLRAVIRYLLHERIRPTVRDVTVIYGARLPGELCYRREFQEWAHRENIRVYLTVDR
ncbi:MAG: FAD-binding oxidoreductase, partial [Kiritimatiellia bacterium]